MYGNLFLSIPRFSHRFVLNFYSRQKTQSTSIEFSLGEWENVLEFDFSCVQERDPSLAASCVGLTFFFYNQLFFILANESRYLSTHDERKESITFQIKACV